MYTTKLTMVRELYNEQMKEYDEQFKASEAMYKAREASSINAIIPLFHHSIIPIAERSGAMFSFFIYHLLLLELAAFPLIIKHL